MVTEIGEIVAVGGKGWKGVGVRVAFGSAVIISIEIGTGVTVAMFCGRMGRLHASVEANRMKMKMIFLFMMNLEASQVNLDNQQTNLWSGFERSRNDADKDDITSCFYH